MPSLPVRQNHHARPRLADHARYFQPVLPGVFDAAVGNIERPPPARAENSRRVRRLARAIFGGAARAHFALRQIENAGALAALGHLQQRAAAGLLHVVAVRGNGQNVEGSRGHVSRDCPFKTEPLLLLPLHQIPRQLLQRIRPLTEAFQFR